MYTSAKVALTPTNKSKIAKHVTFAEPIATVLGDKVVVATGNTSSACVAPCLSPSSRSSLFDPMFEEAALYITEGSEKVKVALYHSNTMVTKEAEPTECTVMETSSGEPIGCTTMETSSGNNASATVAVSPVTNAPTLECASPATLNIPHTTSIEYAAPTTPNSSQPDVVVHTQESTELEGVSPIPVFSSNWTPENHVEIVTEDHLTVNNEHDDTARVQPTLEGTEPMVPDSGHAQPLDAEQDKTTASQTQLEHHTPPDLVDPIDLFLQSVITQPEQPVLPLPVPSEEQEVELVFNSSQRKSTRLANKAKSRLGKGYVELAQDLLVKKLGDLSSHNTQSSQGQEANVELEHFSQHLNKPLNQIEMDALQDLVDHGAKLEKKAGGATVATKKMQAA